MLYARRARRRRVRGPGRRRSSDTRCRRGWQSYLVMALAGTIGYTRRLARRAGRSAIYGGRPLVERHGRWFHLGPSGSTRAERWFDRWGDEAVFLGRVTPVVRSFVSIPAGVFRMPLGRYTLLDVRRLGDLVLRARRHRLGGREQLGELPPRASATSSTSSSALLVVALWRYLRPPPAALPLDSSRRASDSAL